MDLYDYFFKTRKTQKLTLKDLARALDITPLHLSKVMKMKHVPSIELAMRIQEYTNNQVDAVELMKITYENVKKGKEAEKASL